MLSAARALPPSLNPGDCAWTPVSGVLTTIVASTGSLHQSSCGREYPYVGHSHNLVVLVAATAAAAISGYAAIAFLLKYLRTHTAYIFVFYRIVPGTAMLMGTKYLNLSWATRREIFGSLFFVPVSAVFYKNVSIVCFLSIAIQLCTIFLSGNSLFKPLP